MNTRWAAPARSRAMPWSNCAGWVEQDHDRIGPTAEHRGLPQPARGGEHRRRPPYGSVDAAVPRQKAPLPQGGHGRENSADWPALEKAECCPTAARDMPERKEGLSRSTSRAIEGSAGAVLRGRLRRLRQGSGRTRGASRVAICRGGRRGPGLRVPGRGEARRKG